MKRVSVTDELAYSNALDRLTGGNEPALVPKKRRPSTRVKKEEVPEPAETTRIKLSVFLSRGEDAYLESLASTAKFTGGRKISKTKMIEAMVRAFRSSKLDMSGVKNEEELRNRVYAQMRQ